MFETSVLLKCPDPEGWGPISHLRDYDLTSCFEEGALLLPAFALLVVLGADRCVSLSKTERREHGSPSRWLLRSKLCLLVTATFISTANAIYVFLTPNDRFFFGPSYILEPIALLTATALTVLNHVHTRTSSSILLLFWPLYSVVFGIWIRTFVEQHGAQGSILFALRCSGFSLGLISFALECLGPEYGEENSARESPILKANIFSIWCFNWLTPLMKKGVKRFITEDDLPSLPPEDESVQLSRDLENAMSKHKSLTIALFAAFGGPYFVAAVLKLFQDCLAFLQPQLLRLLLMYIANYQRAGAESSSKLPSPLEGFSIAVLMFAAAVSQTMIQHQYSQRCNETGMRVNAGLVNTIYKKALTLSNDERSRASGDIVNLMSVDATRLQNCCTHGLIAISGPFQITLAFISLYNLLGWSAFIGVAIMLFSLPLNTFIARQLKKMQEQQMKNRDKRTRLMSELLANIKSIKLYAWENTFIGRVLEVRNHQELKMLRKIGIVTALNVSIFTGTTILVAFSSFAVAAVTSSQPLTSDKIFPAISLFSLLRFPLAMLSQVVSNIIEAWVSINRLSEFLNAEELQSDARIVIAKERISTGDVVLSIKNGEFSWSKKAPTPTLEGIDLTVRKGELIGVLGRVGAGKTSLLSAIIGDMTRLDGEITVTGSVAYAPQNPWIMSATVRDNILFFHEYDETFYNLVLDACALRQDLATLPNGDMTEVGEKGITLSGGQRARVSLARAIYARADLVLLDDVLAAVDAHVARHVFDQVIGPSGLLSSKARILVTNSVAFLKQHDRLLFIRRGIILESGAYDELLQHDNGELSRLIKGHGRSSNSSGSSTPFPNVSSGEDDSAIASAEIDILEKDEITIGRPPRKQSFGRATVIVKPLTISPSDSPLKEHSEHGKVKWDVYSEYIRAASVLGFLLFVVVAIVQQIAGISGNLVLRAWGEHNQDAGENSALNFYLMAYGLCVLTVVLLGVTGPILMWVFIALRTAKYFHDSMLHAIMRAPLSFFELTPTGRVLNLFSGDLYVVDQYLALGISNVIHTFMQATGILAVISFSFPLFLVAVPPLGWFYYHAMLYYLASSRELRRLEAMSHSPIVMWFSESLGGLSTIRAFTQQKTFIMQNEFRVDHNQICYFPSMSVNQWLAVRLEMLGATVIFIAALLSVSALITSGVDAGLVGLVLSYGFNITSSMNHMVRAASEIEQDSVNVERIVHYIRVEPEAPYEIPGTKPLAPWPSKGSVEFKEYSMRYRPELDLVLKSISMKIMPSEKIGVCGRTGAGKSSLLLALFRILEPASGTIYIDNVDICKLGLHDLRSAISIVPQSPDLFEGTMRENIDPTGIYQDSDIWLALQQSHLKSYVESLPEKLDAPVREGGSSLSSGQRQLICFARALLRKSRILVLDEATSAVDIETDSAIQEIIRGPQFTDITMFTIAHRLNTIMECDRILVLDSGKIAELDAPANLLAKKDSLFYSLAHEAGLA